MTALDEDTWDVSKLVLDDGGRAVPVGAECGVPGERDHLPAARRAVGHRRPTTATRRRPTVIRAASVEMARHSLAIDPLAPVVDAPAGPEGLAFDDPENLMVWWGMARAHPMADGGRDARRDDEATTCGHRAVQPDFKPFEPIVKAATPETVRDRSPGRWRRS